jgi:hypothetical protein
MEVTVNSYFNLSLVIALSGCHRLAIRILPCDER